MVTNGPCRGMTLQNVKGCAFVVDTSVNEYSQVFRRRKKKSFRVSGLWRNSKKAINTQRSSCSTTHHLRGPKQEGRGLHCGAGLDAKPGCGGGGDGDDGFGGRGASSMPCSSLFYNSSTYPTDYDKLDFRATQTNVRPRALVGTFSSPDQPHEIATRVLRTVIFEVRS